VDAVTSDEHVVLGMPAGSTLLAVAEAKGRAAIAALTRWPSDALTRYQNIAALLRDPPSLAVAVPAPEAPEWGGGAAGGSEPLAGAVAAAVACAAPPAAPPASAVSAGAGGDGSSSSSDDDDEDVE